MTIKYTPDKNIDIKGTGWTDENLKTIDANIDSVKTKTDNLPANTSTELSDIKADTEIDGTTKSVILNTVMPAIASITNNSPYCGLHRSTGQLVTKEITITGTNAQVLTNVFKITKNIQIKALYGYIKTATEITKLNNCYFDLYDGTNTVSISRGADASNGANMSGSAVDSFFALVGDETTDLGFSKNDQCRTLRATAGNKEFMELIATQKTGTNTYIRFNTNTDANTNVVLSITIAWVCRESGSAVEAV